MSEQKQTILLMMSRKAVELFVCDQIGQSTEKTSAKPALEDGVDFLQQHVPELGRTCKNHQKHSGRADRKVL